MDRKGVSPPRAPMAPRPGQATQLGMAQRAPGRSPSPPQVAPAAIPDDMQETQDLSEITQTTAPLAVTGRLSSDAREEVWSIVRAALDESTRPDMFRKDTNERLARVEAELERLAKSIAVLANAPAATRSAPQPAATPRSVPPPAAVAPRSVPPPAALPAPPLAPLPPPAFVQDTPRPPAPVPLAATPKAPPVGAASPPPPVAKASNAPPPLAVAHAIREATADASGASTVPRAPMPSRAPTVADWEAAAGSIDVREVGFDGAKRRKRIGVAIGVMLVALIGGSIAVSIASQAGGH